MPLPEENVIICHGDDDIAISQYIQMLEHELGDGAMGDVNITKMDGKTSSENDLVNIVRSTPFFSEKRLVILANPLAKMGRGKRDDSEESESGGSEGSAGDIRKRFINLLDELARLNRFGPHRGRFPLLGQQNQRQKLGGPERIALPHEVGRARIRGRC